jgi:hypothetical protein
MLSKEPAKIPEDVEEANEAVDPSMSMSREATELRTEEGVDVPESELIDPARLPCVE